MSKQRAVGSATRLRIAQVAPVAAAIPSARTASVEHMVWLLTEELVRRGHDVTLFATGDSRTSARLSATFPRGYGDEDDDSAEEPLPTDAAEMINLAEACGRAGEFDIIHCHIAYWPLGPILARASRTPMVQTLHYHFSPGHERLWEACPRAGFVALSSFQRRALPAVRFVGTVHHGLDLASFPFSAEASGYLCYLGRFSVGKGALSAIEIAKRAGRRLVLAGPADDYFHYAVSQRVDGDQIVYAGELDHAGKTALLGGADALLYPIKDPEPFGLVLVEAMACGTPVAALARGAATELIEEGVSGALAADEGELIEKLPLACDLPRDKVRAYAEARYDKSLMVDRYVDIYTQQIARGAGGAPAGGISTSPSSSDGQARTGPPSASSTRTPA